MLGTEDCHRVEMYLLSCALLSPSGPVLVWTLPRLTRKLAHGCGRNTDCVRSDIVLGYRSLEVSCIGVQVSNDGAGFRGCYCGSPLKTSDEAFAYFIDELPGTVRPLHALQLHEADKLGPLTKAVLVSILVFGVEAFYDDGEGLHRDLAKVPVLVETAALRSALRLGEPRLSELI